MYDAPGPPPPHTHAPRTFRGERVLFVTIECWMTISIFCVVMGLSLIIAPVFEKLDEVLDRRISTAGIFLVCVPSAVLGVCREVCISFKSPRRAKEFENPLLLSHQMPPGNTHTSEKG
ncbi:hypothetical protein TNIN_455631 [Trichonephila inaurata madagascariensis]|uniref:Uncharacterized protein n=1 Tax=Trichonephila inaurata madagascariensis TaxID=2747483 RepID=A0A8X6MDX6_9ARAC|nr:hypothetical protein TNIN_455631 [Trichonephila inaurata madagascariensis]